MNKLIALLRYFAISKLFVKIKEVIYIKNNIKFIIYAILGLQKFVKIILTLENFEKNLFKANTVDIY